MEHSSRQLVSVVIPVRDRPKKLLNAVRSVLNQTYPQLELVVVDDHSTLDLSETRALLEKHGHQFLSSPRRGVSAARNFGVDRSEGEYIAFLDSDDEWRPEKLQAQILFHRSQPEFRISQCEEIWIRHGRRVNKKREHAMARGESFHSSLKRCCISPSSVLLERSLFDWAGGFDEALPVCEDYDLWLRITACESIGYLPEPHVVKYGGHSDQLSRSQPAIDRFRLFALLKLWNSDMISIRQRSAVQEEIRERASRLFGGAKKRCDSLLAPFRSELSEMIDNPVQAARGDYRFLLEAGT